MATVMEGGIAERSHRRFRFEPLDATPEGLSNDGRPSVKAEARQHDL